MGLVIISDGKIVQSAQAPLHNDDLHVTSAKRNAANGLVGMDASSGITLGSSKTITSSAGTVHIKAATGVIIDPTLSVTLAPQGAGNAIIDATGGYVSLQGLGGFGLKLHYPSTGSTALVTIDTGNGVFFPIQKSSAPTYRKGGMYFDTTLNKLRIGGATAWETVTSA